MVVTRKGSSLFSEGQSFVDDREPSKMSLKSSFLYPGGVLRKHRNAIGESITSKSFVTLDEESLAR